MLSQNKRQSFVDNDKFNLRKLFPRSSKEWLWKYLGSFFGRKTQDEITAKDFLITKSNVTTSEYFIAVCQK